MQAKDFGTKTILLVLIARKIMETRNKVVYVAEDGSEFSEPKDCLNYELSSKFEKAIAEEYFYNSDYGGNCIAFYEELVYFIKTHGELVHEIMKVNE
jgi:hypothetical protein